MSALAGLRVLELGDSLTAVTGRLLTELGADVVVVEPPEGSGERRRPPFVDDVADSDRSLRWWAHNGAKRSVALDLASEDGRASFEQLVANADIVLEGDASRLDDLRLGWEALGPTAPRLIWVSITPFGRDAGRADAPWTDLTLLAGGGPLWNCGYDDHSIPPIRGAGEQAINIAGHYGAIGALVALLHRDDAGRGQLVEVNANAACNVSSEQVTYNWLLIREVCTRQTGRHAYYVPTAEVQVRCADGVFATTGVLPRLPQEFALLHEWLDELDLVGELPEAVFLEMAAARDRPVDLAAIGDDDEVTAMVEAARDGIRLIASHLPATSFFVESQKRGFPAGAIVSPDEAFADEHTRARGFPVPVQHPELDRTVLHPGVPYVFSASPAIAPGRAPVIGEHTAAVLAEWT